MSGGQAAGSLPDEQQPRVSVVIPAYNSALFLAEAIESVLGQTVQAHEIIVIDDGSTDATASVAASFDGRIRYLRRDNQGPAMARNHGIAAASGEFIAFLDSDDCWEPEMIAEQLAAFRADPAAGLVYTNCWNTDGESLLPLDCSAQRTGHNGHVLEHLVRENFIVTSTVMVRRVCLAMAGTFDPGIRVSEDFDLWLRIAGQFPVRFVPRPLAKYRVHVGGIFGNIDERLRARRQIFAKLAQASGSGRAVSRGQLSQAEGLANCHIADILVRRHERRRARQLYLSAMRLGVNRPRVLFLLATSYVPPTLLEAVRRVRRCLIRRQQCLEVLRPAIAELPGDARPPVVDDRAISAPSEVTGGKRATGMAPGPSVVFVSHHYPPAFSGAGIQAARLAAALQRRGCAVTVLTEAGQGSRQRERSEHDGVTIVRIPAWSRLEFGPLRDRSWSLAVAPTLGTMRADLFHFHGLAGSEVLVAIALARRIPTIIKRSMTSPETRTGRRIRGRWDMMRRFLSRRADRIVAISPRIHAECVAVGIPEDRILPWPNGVDLQSFRPLEGAERRHIRRDLGLPETDFILVTLGGVHERKRQKIQVRALARLEGVPYRVVLLCGGPNRTPYAAELLQEAADLGVQERVLLRHFVDPEVARLALQASDLYTLTSSREGQPNSVLEAMACGLPTVAVHLPGITDKIITQGVDGVLLDSPDDAILAAVWRDLILNEEKRRRLGNAARRAAMRRNDLEELADRYLDLYRSLARTPRRGGERR